MKISKSTLGVILLIASILSGIYGIMLRTGAESRYFTWVSPYTQFETKTFMYMGIGIIGIIISLVLVFSKKEKE